MSGPMTWGTSTPAPVPNDPAESLRRIEANTAELVTWMKYLVGAVVVLVIVNVLFVV
jgi:hypothetical protein